LPRIGMNPGRGKTSEYSPARVTVCVLTCLPNDIGYFKNRLDVTRVCIESIIQNTKTPYDLMVFDNGSSAELVNYLLGLKSEGKIDFLILSSQNIGKIGALQVMFRSAPGEVIAYTDDDVFFLPGCLERQLEVVDTYPDVGMVTGMYIKPHMKEGIQSTLDFSKREDVETEVGKLIDPETEKHYIKHTGRTWERYNEEIEGLVDIRMTFRGVQTYASAGHYQFISPKERIIKALPENWTGNLMGQMRDLDRAVDELGYLRLCNHTPTVRLLGNLIDEEAAEEIRHFGIEIKGAEKSSMPPSWKKRIYRLPIVRKIAYFLYERLFKIINA